MKFKRRFRRKFKYNKKRSFMFILFFLICLSFGLGYSLIQTDINIFGTTVLKDNRWDVHFDNIQEVEDSVSPTSEPEITNNTTVTFSAKLKKPGDKYEFLIDVVNAGTIDAKIGSITMSPELTEEQQNYFSYEVKYKSDLALVENQALDAGTTETLKVSFNYLEQEDNSLYPGDDQTFNVTLTLDYVQGTGDSVNHPIDYLYNVLKEETETGGLAKKYTGAHHDSFTKEPSKDIYHWYASTYAEGTEINNKNNVVFADYCWKMLRTTDTGGVKMIYNGAAIDGKCLANRGKNASVTNFNNYTDLDYEYLYGTDYTYDYTTNSFKISGDTQLVKADISNYNNLLDKFTCKTTNIDYSCTKLYYLKEFASYTNNRIYFKTYELSPMNYPQIGLTYTWNNDINRNYMSRVGYMYNNTYINNSKQIGKTENVYDSSRTASNYYFADSISYDSTTGNYSLVNPYIIEASDTSNMIGKYTFFSNNSALTYNSVYFTTAYQSVSGNKYLYYIYLTSGNDINYYNYQYTYGTSYTENNDGTYTINNPKYVNRVDWANNNYISIRGNYICRNAINNICTDLWYITNSTISNFSYIDVNEIFKYSKSFTYSNGKYILSDNIISWNTKDYSILNNAHYTCWNRSGECTKISYIYYDFKNMDRHFLFYIDLEDGKGVEDALREMLYDDNVNKSDNYIKSIVDFWFSKKLLSESDMLEETIFCNDRNIKELGGWNPNGGSVTKFLTFKESTPTEDLSCVNVTDRFSVSNPKAKLKYKVGLATSPELNIMGNQSVNSSPVNFWILSPHGIINNYWKDGLIKYVSTNGYILNEDSNIHNIGIRPVISIKSGIKYFSGNGSMESPYIIN